MAATGGTAGKPAAEANFTRELNAPRELAWDAWTDPKHVAQWFGPHGFTNPVCEWDSRPGGAIRIHMRAPDGSMCPLMKGEFREVVRPERLRYTSWVVDDAGELLFEVDNLITFAERAGKTILTVLAKVTQASPRAVPFLSGMETGWSQGLERLAGYVSKIRANQSPGAAPRVG